MRSEHRDATGFRAGSGKFCIIFGPAGRIRGSGPPAGSCKCEKGESAESAGQIRGFDPRVSQKQPAGHGGLIDPQVTRISRVMTRPDSRDFQTY